ncbi:glycosyltransferase [Candidatus Woesebacteria bacterium]|nr:glycosyltransferase [Candidatus Woesebacteria bacterium]
MLSVSLCITILNEEQSLSLLLTAISNQTVPPDELLIVDGGSTDLSLAVIESVLTNVKKQTAVDSSSHVFTGCVSNTVKSIPVRVRLAKGSRSVGRNTAISLAKNDWIAITDAGCIPHEDWLEQLLTQQSKSQADVVAGYYDALPKTPFEEAVVPYVLVMPNKVNVTSFLPATRSMLLHKKVWSAVGNFDETLSDNEDYAFAKKIAKTTSISFAKAAIVSWLPSKNIRGFYTMIMRFARGDVRAGLIRPKVIILFARYLLAVLVVLGLILNGYISSMIALFIVLGAVMYSSWAIAKNVRYAPRGWSWLPLLQFTADAAVMHGSLLGIVQRIQYQAASKSR